MRQPDGVSGKKSHMIKEWCYLLYELSHLLENYYYKLDYPFHSYSYFYINFITEKSEWFYTRCT